MSARQDPPAATPPTEITDADLHPVPDEDGPHDVPDDKVIEATLPSTPVNLDGSDSSHGS